MKPKGHETTFESLNLIPSILKALKIKNYVTPTPVQEESIPLILAKHDLLATAQTGTGKTAAFAIPIIQNLVNNSKNERNRKVTIKALIVTPTRELAIQINENIKSYAQFTDIRYAVIFGGVKQGAQVKTLNRGVDILVATPGRLLDLIGQRIINLRSVETFVLDEADRMLDMGFIHDIRKLLDLLPDRRQSLFFSATMPKNIVTLSQKILTNPRTVEVAAVSSAAETIQQFLYYTNKADKKNLLLHILENKDIEQALLFSRTKHGADKIVRLLLKFKIKAAAIHGNKSQNQRQKALKSFVAKDVRVLVATDIAARGIDINELKYVINYDISNIAETYVHRIGRAGRAGKQGIAISMCEPEENAYVKDIQKLINQKLTVIKENPFPQTDKPMTNEEKKQFEKEKKSRKQEYFSSRKKQGPRDKKKSYSKKRRN